jgi:hypothetical protein
MKMLVPVDTNPYSAVASRKAARLAINTWADVTMLGIQTKSSGNAVDAALSSAMTDYCKAFIGTTGEMESPYGDGEIGPWHQGPDGV